MEHLYNGETLVLEDKIAYLGLYPQDHVCDQALIHSLNNIANHEPNGWYLLNGKYYARCIAHPNLFMEVAYQDGCLVEEGAVSWFCCKPIKWRVLQNEGEEVYLLADLILDAHRFDESVNEFDHSKLKMWLQSTFQKQAFSLCKDVKIEEVSLLSLDDAMNDDFGFTNDEARKASPSDWTLAKKASIHDGFTWYWTKSKMFEDSKGVTDIDYYGSPTDFDHIEADDIGVRPTLRVKLLEEDEAAFTEVCYD